MGSMVAVSCLNLMSGTTHFSRASFQIGKWKMEQLSCFSFFFSTGIDAHAHAHAPQTTNHETERKAIHPSYYRVQ